MLTRALSDDFPPAMRRRGEEYASRDRVSLEAGSEHSVLALVSGQHEYVVELWRKGDTIRALCGCPGYVDAGACPHLWAALVLAERRGLLRAGDAPSRLVLEEHPDADAIRRLGQHDADPSDALPDLPEDPAPSLPFDEPTVEAPDALGAPGPPPPSPGAAPTDEGAPISEAPRRAPAAPRGRDWRRLARELSAAARGLGARPERPLGGQSLLYVIDLELSRELGALVLALLTTRGQPGGVAGPGSARKTMRLSLRRDDVAELEDADDREVLLLLSGARPATRRSALEDRTEQVPSAFRLDRDTHAAPVERIARAGRLFLRESDSSPLEGPVKWEQPLAVRLRLVPMGPVEPWSLHADVVSHAERLSSDELRLAAPGFVVLPGLRIALLDDEAGHRFIVDERLGGPLRIPVAEVPRAVSLLSSVPGMPALDAPSDVALERREVAPRPRFVVRRFGTRSGLLAGELSFDYDGKRVDEDASESLLVDESRRLIFVRDEPAERAARQALRDLRVRPPREDPRGPRPWLLSPRRLSELVSRLVEAGWIVEAEGRRQRAAGRVSLQASSETDWFELRGEVDFEGLACSLPEILRALERNEPTVRLSDGSQGLLPEAWLARHAPWLSLGRLRRDHVRFAPSQAALLDALLAAEPGSTCDAALARLRARLATFEGLVPEAQPEGFAGTLRDYQRQGLAWMRFLREAGFGGCLADDMGVGKTAQVLAMLAARRQELPESKRRPSLIVVPRSLVFNWRQEAARFTPGLSVADHSGASRNLAQAREADLITCTYGTMRRDIALLRDIEFDYVILDEAQAIKNAGTSAAKSARLLRSRHRLALSGTPIENHLGELWSLFEFLNPGMLGRASAFRAATARPDEHRASDRALLARALRPFLLRRTKQQVARELPARTEQTIRCALAAPHRRWYDELRTHYRRELLGLVDARGMGASRLHVLEALLRLRQIACHPGLVDPGRRAEPSAKLDMLVDRLCELADEGHKALVFSQFTTFLRIVRDRLRQRGIAHEYLDGATRDRQERVSRFQSDEGCHAFLISLKAGGTGLNLTSADYVFLLDPWWNPAVEAQAIDRSHRMGQKRPVMAYRLIAADTVEERVLEMQAEKRALAEEMLGNPGILPAELGRQDLELLLS